MTGAVVTVARVLSDPTRVRILALLRTSELCVCEICDALEVTQSTLSSHLQVMREAGMLQVRRDGKWVYYVIEPSFTQVVGTLLDFSPNGQRTDPRLQRDAERTRRRLQIREGGRCLRGFDQLGHERR